MGFTDPPNHQTLYDVYPVGTPFTIFRAWIEGVVSTAYGDKLMGKILVGPARQLDSRQRELPTEEFSVWGSLCQQIQSQEEGDFPGVYKVVVDGKRKLFQAADLPEQFGADSPF